jgi:hypothetical protein
MNRLTPTPSPHMKTSILLKNPAVRTTILGFTLAVMVALTTLAQQETAGTPVVSRVDPGNLRAFIELVRSDLQNEKATIIAENIEFTEDEAFEFWPLHREYTLELNKLLDQRLSLIREHVASFDRMTDQQATQLANEVFKLEAQRLNLKRTWFRRFSKVTPPKKAAQFFQLENQLNAALDLRVAAELPLIKLPGFMRCAARSIPRGCWTHYRNTLSLLASPSPDFALAAWSRSAPSPTSAPLRTR